MRPSPPGNTYGTATLTWTPSAQDAGIRPITFRVTDSGNGNSTDVFVDEEQINLTVRSSNMPPILAPIGDLSVDEEETLNVTLSAFDADGDAVTYSMPFRPPGATFNAQTGTFTWKPRFFQAAEYRDAIFTVTDGSGSSSETVAITVRNVNQPPVIAPLALQSGREDVALQFTLAAGDVDGDLLSFAAASALPNGARFDSKSAQFQWTPTFDAGG